MPIYEYHCEDCGEHFEYLQKITEDPKTECEKCGGHLVKEISLSSFQLKGSGWYVTDYKGKNPTNGSGATEASASNGNGSAKSDDSKSETTKKEDKPAKETKSTKSDSASS